MGCFIVMHFVVFYSIKRLAVTFANMKRDEEERHLQSIDIFKPKQALSGACYQNISLSLSLPSLHLNFIVHP